MWPNIGTNGWPCWCSVRRLFISSCGTSGCTGRRARSRSGGIWSRRMPVFWCWPHPASGPIWPRGYLKLACERLARDWQEHFGYPVQVVETFVDPQRFRGTCYKAAGWQQLGPTQGFGRRWQDFYTDTQHPKQLWVRALSPGRLEQVRAPELPAALADPQGPLPPACPVPTARLGSLWECFHQADDRSAQAQGSAPQTGRFVDADRFGGGGWLQRAARDRRVCPKPQPGPTPPVALPPATRRPREYDVPSERTFRRLLKKVDPEPLKDVLVGWMQARIRRRSRVVHVDGKVVKNAQPAPPRDPGLSRQRPLRPSPAKSRPNCKSPRPTRP